MTKTNPTSVEKIREFARKFRAECGIKQDECFPVLDVLQKMYDNKMIGIQIINDSDNLLDESTPAIYNANDNFIYLKESVLEDYENNNYRANFTLAHELFHYIQTKVLNYEFEEVDECKTYEDIDWQANEFAGEILLPSEYLYMNEEELSKRFKVTVECALTRKLKKKKRLEYKETSQK